MDKRKLNTKWILFMFLFLVLISLGICLIFIQEKACVGTTVIATGFAFALFYWLLFPNSYCFSETCVIVYYAFGIKTELKWNDVAYVRSCHSRSTVFFWKKEYRIGRFNTKNSFWQEVPLPKTVANTEIIQKYYEGKIENIH